MGEAKSGHRVAGAALHCRDSGSKQSPRALSPNGAWRTPERPNSPITASKDGDGMRLTETAITEAAAREALVSHRLSAKCAKAKAAHVVLGQNLFSS
eukprot:scaffold20734_cov118-Isochrysis_galbana.AAC.6